MDALVNILRAAGESTRLRILAILARGELTVTELTQVLGQSQPRVSRHLKLLVEAGLLARKPEGSWAFYRLAAEGRAGGGDATKLVPFLAGLVPGEDPALARDLVRLEMVKAARAAAAEAYFKANARDWDRLRSLHVSEAEVETAILDLVGPGPYRHCLDLGTGTGRMLQLLAPRIRNGTGLDSNREMLTLARNVLDRPEFQHCEVRQADLFALPFAGRAAGANGPNVDLILIHQVLHYLADPAAAISEASRVLAPGGRILIVDFAPHGIEELRLRHAHRRLGFDADEVAGLLRAAGLVLDTIKHLAPERGAGGEERLTVTLWLAQAP